jgi:uncharacterized membrane protein YphA (DoxX/SURF4 family)
MTVVAYVALFGRIAIGLILVLAAAGKILDQPRTAVIVGRYELLPKRVGDAVAYVLGWLELALGTSLVLGVGTRWAILAATLLFVVFFAAIAINLARGRRDIGCGCFGWEEEQRLSWLLALRTLSLAAASAALAIPWVAAEAEGVPVDVTWAAQVIMLGSLAVLVLFRSVFRLESARRRILDEPAIEGGGRS